VKSENFYHFLLNFNHHGNFYRERDVL